MVKFGPKPFARPLPWAFLLKQHDNLREFWESLPEPYRVEPTAASVVQSVVPSSRQHGSPTTHFILSWEPHPLRIDVGAYSILYYLQPRPRRGESRQTHVLYFHEFDTDLLLLLLELKESV